MKHSIFWFRRDLRLEDNVGLSEALASGFPIQPIFIFDERILEELNADDPRVNFIYDSLEAINDELKKHHASLKIYKGDPKEVWEGILSEHEIAQVFVNKDYEPYALKRDLAIEELALSKGVQFKSFKDQVIFEESEVVKDDGSPYTVFTPFKKKWLKTAKKTDFVPKKMSFEHFLPSKLDFMKKSELGITPSKIKVLPFNLNQIENYSAQRDTPSIQTTNLSPHLRFGTIGIRDLFNQIDESHETFISELIWREFFMQILFHFPNSVSNNFKSKYDGIHWRNNEEEFKLWCKGETGYPMVDAGMRQLNESGYMHNRVRMVVASFLVKHLLIDWRWGEAYFASKLLDFELSSNVGNWQWAAGTGCDSAPYFRIFNPHEQLKKFDPKLEYVRKWVPEVDELTYARPMVEHKMARERCLKTYKEGLGV
ncbi:MAG: deoxyribodipyrimidine photolyase [Crocinitomix sp. MedPE-SWsnd]|nr:MAG: deoxyribodipyrimidine photolyase [Crocinitomix sp. MedPE-SWsnd]